MIWKQWEDIFLTYLSVGKIYSVFVWCSPLEFLLLYATPISLAATNSFYDFENLKKSFWREKNIFVKSNVSSRMDNTDKREQIFDRKFKNLHYILMEYKTKVYKCIITMHNMHCKFWKRITTRGCGWNLEV